MGSLATATGNSDVDQAVTEYFIEERIKALETSCTHRGSILVGKTRATHTRMQGRFVMGQLGMPREDRGDNNLVQG